jgi:hypothetical protein
MTADERQNILLEKNLLLTEYGNIQASIQSIKDDINTEIELFQYEDELSRAEYGLMYEEYQANISSQAEARSDADQRAYDISVKEFEQQNKVLAAERQNEYDLELKEIEQQYKVRNQKPEYKTDSE